jgi:hypothetical protein
MNAGQLLQSLSAYEDFKMEKKQDGIHVHAGGSVYIWGGWLHAEEAMFEAWVYLRAHEIAKQKETK